MQGKSDVCEIKFNDKTAYEREKAIYIAAKGLVPELLEYDDAKHTLYVQKINGRTVQELVSGETGRVELQSILFPCIDDLMEFQKRIKNISLPEWNREACVTTALADFEWLKERNASAIASNWQIKRAYVELAEYLKYSGPVTLENTHGGYFAKNIIVADNHRYIINFENTSRSPPVLDFLRLSEDPEMQVEWIVRRRVIRRANIEMNWEEADFLFASEYLSWTRKFADLEARQDLPAETRRKAEQCRNDAKGHLYNLVPEEDDV